MIEKILFVQPFGLKKEHLTDEILIWEVYLENFLKSKNPSLHFDLLYLPIEQEKGRITISSFKERELFEKQMNGLVSEIKFKPDKNTLICVSGTTSHHFLSSKHIGEYFQKYFPTALIVFGGAHASARPNDFSYPNSPFDYVIVGEGELPLYNLLIDSATKQEDPIIIESEPISDLNDLPELDFSIFNKYMKHFKHLSISLSRGCPFKCHFCMEKNLSKTKNMKPWRSYSPERAIQEVATMIKYGSEYGIKAYGFYDPIFGMNKKWLSDFLEGYNFGDLTYAWIETRLDIINEELLEKLDYNNFNVMYGVESFSKEMLRIMNKTSNPSSYLQKFNNIFEIYKQSGRLFMINILVNHPGETFQSYEETFNVLKKMVVEDDIDPITFNIRFYHHFPGTRNYNNFNQFNKKHGAVAYFPEWYEDEALLEFGPYCVRPSFELSLRESFKTYTILYQELLKQHIQNIKRKGKSKETLGKILISKRQIRALDEKMEKFFKFLDDNGIEAKEDLINPVL